MSTFVTRAALRVMREGVAWTASGARPARHLVSFLETTGLLSRDLLATRKLLPRAGIGPLLDPFDISMLGARAPEHERAGDEPGGRRLSAASRFDNARPASRPMPAARQNEAEPRVPPGSERGIPAQRRGIASRQRTIVGVERGGLTVVPPPVQRAVATVRVRPGQLEAVLARFAPDEWTQSARSIGPTARGGSAARASGPASHAVVAVHDVLLAAVARAETTLERWTRGAGRSHSSRDRGLEEQTHTMGRSSVHGERRAPRSIAGAPDAAGVARRVRAWNDTSSERTVGSGGPRGGGEARTQDSTAFPRSGDSAASLAPARIAEALERAARSARGARPGSSSAGHATTTGSVDLATTVNAAFKQGSESSPRRDDSPATPETLHFIGEGLDAIQGRLAELGGAPTPRPSVEWLADDGDLADRLHRILSRQALRRGIDLS